MTAGRVVRGVADPLDDPRRENPGFHTMPPGILSTILLTRRSTLMFYRAMINFDVNLAIDSGNITENSNIDKREMYETASR